jgi:2-C-methyl-D-erythritol 4-phosphate cytidylyltransferase/2-C-methyl-D-erythritol 2,4-cyclodiphosphate synthase
MTVAMVEGDEDNVKLTTAEDFWRAERFAASEREVRTGLGFDVHRFGAGDRVMLCGLAIPHDAGLIGHSDADVALHALTDALLGAVGAGDIGSHFPPSDPQWRGASSEIFLSRARDMVVCLGGRILNVDVTVICERPRIGPHRQAMCERLAAILEMPVHRVSVKATTTEKLGFTGREEGIAAYAIASVEVPTPASRPPASP